jgi:acetyltransferase-like isoleucine patch superfamily enzyme
MSNASAPSQDHLLNRVRNALYFGVRYPWVRRGRNVHVKWSTVMWSPHKHIVIGDNVGIGYRCVLHCDIEIGNKVMIAGHVAMIGADDHRYDVVGQAMWDSGRGDARKVIVEDDVWIGHGAIILSGSRIGRGAIVAAGSVIAGDVEPYSIVIPPKASLVRKRLAEKDLSEHERILRESRDK